MKAYRNVNLTIGLMTLPVSIASYASETSDPRPTVVGPEGQKLRQIYVYADEDDLREVFKDETKRDFDGKVVSQEELRNISAACKIEDLEIQEVCDLKQIDNLRAQKSFYVYPNKKTGNPRVFKTFVDALKKTKKAAIVKWTPSSRQQLLALKVEKKGSDDVLVGTALSFSTDVQEVDTDVTGFNSEKVEKRELDMAIQLLDAIGGEGDALHASCDEAIAMKRELIDGTRELPAQVSAEENQEKAQSFLADMEASLEAIEKEKK